MCMNLALMCCILCSCDLISELWFAVVICVYSSFNVLYVLICCLCLFVSFAVPYTVLSSDRCRAPSLLCPPRFSQRELGGGEEEEEDVAVEVICLPASGYDLELYTPEQLCRHRPLEAPVSPRKHILKAMGRKKKVTQSRLSCSN